MASLRESDPRAANTKLTDDGKYKVYSSSNGEPDIPVNTLHLSCSSDAYRRDDPNYAGFILYAYNGKTDWRLNGINCQTGYIVIRSTREGGDVDRCRSPETPGAVHGAVYKSVFGENPDNKVVGEGFSFMNGEFKGNSNTFNAPLGSNYHDHHKWMSRDGGKCVEKVVELWKSVGEQYEDYLPPCRTWNVHIDFD